jgi:nucleoside-diphosphate-sugar epimerase
MKVAVSGGTGVAGREVCQLLAENGVQYSLLTRKPVAASSHVGDILVRDSLYEWLDGCDVAVHLATSLKRNSEGLVDWSSNDAVRELGTENLIRACQHVGVARCVLQSVAFIDSEAFPNTRGTEPLAPIAFLQSAVRMEQTALGAAGMDCCILRGGLYYGPGTELSGSWAKSAAAGVWTVPRHSERYVSLVHITDMARALLSAVLRGPRGVCAVVDDMPLRWQDLMSGLASTFRGELRASDAPLMLPSFRVSNALARTALGWRPRYCTWREGVTAGL